MRCDLVFTKSDKNLISKIINKVTKGNISHVAIISNSMNTKVIEATNFGIKLNDFDKTNKIIIRISGLTEEQKTNILLTANDAVEKNIKYDWTLFFTIMFNRWFGFIPKDDYKRFICSEFILNTFLTNGIDLLENTKYSNKDNLTPYELYCALIDSHKIELMEVL